MNFWILQVPHCCEECRSIAAHIVEKQNLRSFLDRDFLGLALKKQKKNLNFLALVVFEITTDRRTQLDQEF